MLGHELRNPLAAIVHAAALVQRSEDRETLEWASELVDRQAGQMTRLVEELLDVARINQGRIEIQPAETRLRDLLSRAVETCRNKFREKNQELFVSLPSETVTLEVDPERIVQVVTNLLDNASKYTPEGGEIWLKATVDGDRSRIEVRDNGEGLSEEELDEIFDLFSQADRQPGSSPGGLGVGLNLVRQIVRTHGGTVRAFSEGRGHGSRFVIDMPGSVVESESDDVPTPGIILVIEDSEDHASAVGPRLEAFGAMVHTADSGRGGIELTERLQPDLVLVDIDSPDIDGLELARRLQQTEARRPALLVALIGSGTRSTIDEAREAGFDRVLAKPATPDELRDLLDEVG